MYKSVESAMNSISNYLKNDDLVPYFLIVDDDDEYREMINNLVDFVCIRASKYCVESDVFPDMDALLSCISRSENKTLLIGVGEAAAFSGNENILGKIADLSFSTKIVVVCRRARAYMNDLCNDKKFSGRRTHFMKISAPDEIIQISPALSSIQTIDGFRALLSILEEGAKGIFYVKTLLKLRGTREVDSAYDVISLDSSFNVPQTSLPDDLWVEYLEDKNLEGYDLSHWRSFLKLKLQPPSDSYLEYVVESSPNYAAYQKSVYWALLDFEWSDAHFSEMYRLRKALLKDSKDYNMAEYIAQTVVKDNNRIFYLTDNTAVEKRAIIECLEGLEKIPLIVKDIYPALAEYLHSYAFPGETGELLTYYFNEYKRLKLTNRLTQEFNEKVQNLALDGKRIYNSLKTRGYVLDSLDKTNTALYWIDSLGSEYLGFIQSRAKLLGLRINVHVVRANLPTITSQNSDFYDSWEGPKEQTKELDKIKHFGEMGFNYQTVKTPVHLTEELRIINHALEWAKAELAGKSVDKIILASDHGASRLAVINEQECKWEMASRGEHSGRCCLCSEADVKYEFATQENGFWVLANYDRFKGGRKASVEVHGGAALEEVVIPLIEIELADKKIEITNITPITTTSYKKSAEIVLFSTSLLKKVSVFLNENGEHSIAEPLGNNKHKLIFPNIKKSGKYTGIVYEGDNIIGEIEFEAKRESGKEIDLFS